VSRVRFVHCLGDIADDTMERAADRLSILLGL
jgi:hypothetical protein